MQAPEIIDDLVTTVQQQGPEPPKVLAWKEYDDKFVIVLEDGRKLSFKKEDHGPRRKQTAADMKGAVEVEVHQEDKHRGHKEK